jgi:hypothetical protein
VFLRALGAVYLAAFWSLAIQVDGLLGSRGILPASRYLDLVHRALGPRRFLAVPTLLWFDSSDGALHALCWGGAALSVLLIAGLLPGVCVVLLWAFYLSLTVVGQEFLGYQWDALLLETGLLAILLAPWQLWLGRSRRETPRVAIWLIRWLLFRLMFLSGVVKLASGDPAWRQWEALRYHYETQPLPTWTSWYAHQGPPWFQALSTFLMFVIELVAPFLIFGPRVCRWIALVSLGGLQFMILATGNYGAFNILSLVLCIPLLDDRDLRVGSEASKEVVRAAPASRIITMIAAIVIVLLSSMETINRLAPGTAFPAALEDLSAFVAPFRSLNSYGLFAVMTTERPEITVEGSSDGVEWKPYRFRWKPGELDRRPRFVTPHMPRLDWQMWFAALGGDCRASPWFLAFEIRLLEGSPPVLGLLRENPFPEKPPRFLRARLERYRFTTWGESAWWRAQELGPFCPEVELRDGHLDTR